MLPNRTTLVTPLEIENFPKYISALDLVQRAVTRLAALNRTAAEMEKIRKADEIYMEAVASGDFHSLTESNKTLHMEIGQAANNPYFLKHYERLLDEGQRLSHLHFDFMVTSSTGDELGQDHADLVDAIDRKDADAAEQLAHEHTMLFQHRFLNMMRQNTTQSMTILHT